MFNQLVNEVYSKLNLSEAIEASDKEYYQAISKHYSKDLVQTIKQFDKMAQMMFGKIETYKTNDGSMIVRYVDSAESVVVLGIVSVPGVEKTDYMKDILQWIDKVLKKLEQGKTLMTSPNKLSEPLLKKIISKAERKGLKLQVDKAASGMEDSATGQQWTNYIISTNK
jgi:uncharacterized radical SAM superfamily Fe-S cluster-containing enzyme